MDIPYGRLLKGPHGVINVVNKRDYSDSLLCQKALFAFILENIFDFDNFPNVNSTVGRGYASLNMLLFNLVKSTHIRTSLGFGVTTIGAHHAVG